MKPYILLFILSTIEFASLRAQNLSWAVDGAAWNYSAYSMLSIGYVSVQNFGDTVVADHTCKKLTSTYHFQMVADTNETGQTTLDDTFTYSENNQVYAFRNGIWQLIYDFDMLPGDSYTISSEAPCSMITTITVTNSGTEVLNGISLKFVELLAGQFNQWGFGGKVYERVGPLQIGIFGQPTCFADALEVGDLRCYSDDAFWSYTLSEDCTAISLSERSDKYEMIVYPNPTGAYFIVQLNLPNLDGNHQLLIIDSMGKLVYQQNIANAWEKVTIDVQQWSLGTYQAVMIKEGTVIETKEINVVR